MKKPYLLLILSLLIIFFVSAKYSIGKQPITNPILKGYILTIQSNAFRSYDTIIHKKTYTIFHIPVKLTNSTKAPLKYITMTCSWYDIFHLNNKHFEIYGWACDSNYPIVAIVFPNKSTTFVLLIIKRKISASIETLKVGMNIFIDNAGNRNLFPLPVEKKDNVIWSNEVKVFQPLTQSTK
jgi:hypothetical protein